MDLSSIFARLEHLNKKMGFIHLRRSDFRASMTDRTFDRRQVRNILALYYGEPGAPMGKGVRSALERRLRAIQALEREGMPQWVSGPLTEWRCDMQFALRQDNRSRKQTGLRCPSTSLAVTRLTTYMWGCLPVRIFLKESHTYRLIGEIISLMTHPACPLCGREHQFKTWQAVKARDDYSGAWETRAQRAHVS